MIHGCEKFFKSGYVANLMSAQVPAQEAITSLVLDAPLPPEDKVSVARALGDELTSQSGRIPDLDRAFTRVDVEPASRPALDRLERDLGEQLERAATHAFRDSFLLGAGLALLALPGERLESIRRVYSIAAALAQADEFLRSRPWTVQTTYNTAGAAPVSRRRALGVRARLARPAG